VKRPWVAERKPTRFLPKRKDKFTGRDRKLMEGFV